MLYDQLKIIAMLLGRDVGCNSYILSLLRQAEQLHFLTSVVTKPPFLGSQKGFPLFVLKCRVIYFYGCLLANMGSGYCHPPVLAKVFLY